MAAATNFRHITCRGGNSCDRAGLGYILAETKWYRGTVIVGHNDRMMAYPTNGFNSTVTATAGGPLQVPGADANGGLRVIAKEPAVRFQLTAVGAGTAATVTVEETAGPGTGRVVIVAANLSTTAETVFQALHAHAEAMSLIDVARTGNGTGIVADIAQSDVPFVRLLGLANGDVDASADVADVVIDDPTSYPYTVRHGELGLEMDAAFSLPGKKYIADNQTLTENYAPLLLSAFCVEVEDGLAFVKFE